jgi:hypothetical protein
MGAKKKPIVDSEEDDSANSSVLEMMRSIKTELSALNTKMEKLDTVENEVKSLKSLITDLKNENSKLKADLRTTEKKLEDMNDRNNSLENRLNSLEQHHRGWSARILNIPLSKEEESDNFKVREKVYHLALLPILRGAVEKKILSAVPDIEQLLEVAHVLPGPAGFPKPIIIRFYNRNLRDICFRLKKYHAPREEARSPRGDGASGGIGGGEGDGGWGSQRGEAAGGFEGRGKYCFPLYEDLTRAAFQKMRAISKDGRVKACWSTKGQIKFILHSNLNEVKRVSSLLDPLDTILK